MEHAIAEIYSTGTIAQASGLIAMAIFFIVVSVRELRDEHPAGFFMFALSTFFAVIHVLLLAGVFTSGPLGQPIPHLNMWTWLASLLAPAVIGLFLLKGLYGLLSSDTREGMVKMFFGLTLLCFLHMIGTDWPVDVKAVMTVVWLTVFFKMELGDLRY